MLLCQLNVFESVLLRNLRFCNGVISAHLKALTKRNYQVADKKKDDLHEQQEDIFDDDKDDTITVSG